MTRDIFLVVYHSPLFAAHWSLWVPSAKDPAIGKIIHVTGDAITGFDHEFKRNYSFADTLRKYSLIHLSSVEDKHVVDTPGDGSLSLDKDPVDDIERKALTVPAPGKSLLSAASQVSLAISRSLFCPAPFADLRRR